MAYIIGVTTHKTVVPHEPSGGRARGEGRGPEVVYVNAETIVSVKNCVVDNLVLENFCSVQLAGGDELIVEASNMRKVWEKLKAKEMLAA